MISVCHNFNVFKARKNRSLKFTCYHFFFICRYIYDLRTCFFLSSTIYSSLKSHPTIELIVIDS